MQVMRLTAAALLAVVLSVACGGGGSPTGSRLAINQPVTAAGETREALELSFQYTPLPGGNYRVMLMGRGARDLYQLAGSVLFDESSYELLLVEAGGGLGGPEDCHFLEAHQTPGRIDFAYTRRWHGTGADGDLALLGMVLRPLGDISEGDFRLDDAEGALLLRDSRRRPIGCRLPAREDGND